MVERFTFAKTLPSRNLSEGDRRQVSKVCPQGKVLEGSWAKFNPNSVFIVFLSNYALLNTTRESGVKWCYGFSIQHSLQEMGLCLSSINHFTVTGGGALVSQPTPQGDLKRDNFPRAWTQTKKRVWQDEAIKASAKPVLSSYSSYTISILEYRQM